MSEDGPSFEEAELELRRIVERLEGGEVSVDEALTLWERGENLYRVCRDQLDAAEGKVEELAQRVQAAKPSA
jgi:exodeoxyribonuclease VII small subunit